MFIQINPNHYVNLYQVTCFEIAQQLEGVAKTSDAFKVYTAETKTPVIGTLEYLQPFLDATIKFSQPTK